MMEVATYSIRDGLSQADREFPALQDSYIPLYELDWIKVFSLMREYARSVSLDAMFSGQELAVISLLLSMDGNRPDIRRALERGEGVQGLRGLLQFCERELAAAQSPAGRELCTLVHGLLHGVQSDYGPPQNWQGDFVQSALLQAVKMAQERARQLLPAILASGNNEPAISLYAVFARLHERLVVQVNRLPGRRIDFYYQELLGDNGRSVEPDHVHLVLPVNAIGREILLEKGCEFSGGQDGRGDEIVFSSVQDVSLNDAVVADMRTLHFQEGIPWEDHIPIYDPAKLLAGTTLRPYSLFGNTRDGVRPATAMVPGIGFAVASPVLFLQEGNREISFRFDYEIESLRGTVLDVGETQENSYAVRCDAFLRAFKDMFHISATSAEGWLALPAYKPSFYLLDDSLPEGSLGIRLRLAHDVAPIVPYDPAIHGESWPSQLPVFRFLLNPEACEYGAELLQRLVVRQIRIDVVVDDCRKLVLQNQIGPLSAMAPFQPFGPLPAPGDYLLVGCAETIAKALTDFQVEIEWGGLPDSVTDFRDWYDGYDDPPGTKDFVARLGVLSDGRWHPTSAEYPVVARLFHSAKVDNARIRISPRSVISCKAVLATEKTLAPGELSQEFVYGPETKNGFFRISLAGPVGAFQHQVYPHVLSKALTFNAKVKHERLCKPLPKMPYTPVVHSIKVRYSAKALIPMSKSGKVTEDPCSPRMLYLHPWGWEDAAQVGQHRISQIPVRPEAGSLYLGLRMDRIPRSLSLYFHLSRDSEGLPAHASQRFSWWYLSARGWVSFPAQGLQGDSTNHFTSSGIVRLTLPRDMVQEHSMMPHGKFWIQIRADKGCDFCCRVFSVFAQAVEAVRVQGFSGKNLECLVSGSVNQMRKSIAGLSGVFQIAPSWGGREPENKAAQRTRIAERLSHKQRAFAPQDYERLVLEAFPQVFKAKCFAGIDPAFPDRLTPGHLLFVPVSHLFSDGRQQWKPRLGGHVLHDIEEFLKPLMPPAAQIHVMNPYFEKIQVRCVVRFGGTQSSGMLLKRLNTAICNYLSPWHAPGYRTHFGWCARRHDLESFIREQNDVEEVSECSLLRISPMSGKLFQMDESGTENRDEIRGAYPWSIAVPMRKHFLNAFDCTTGEPPLSLGYGDLEIGSTFILQSGNANGENE